MKVFVSPSKQRMGRRAAHQAAQAIRQVIDRQRRANIILATGASQFETLQNLAASPGIAWSRVTMFHLDEYIGMPETHPASFRKYLKERFLEKVAPLKAVYFVEGDRRDPEQERRRLGEAISRHPIDVALVGIGENGHLAFNDPPADFETEEPFIAVNLDQTCRRQQLGEGWFQSLEEVPTQAISMSIRQIMKTRCIIVSCPDQRKAAAVRDALEGPISNRCPASILQQHPDCRVFLDEASASLLTRR